MEVTAHNWTCDSCKRVESSPHARTPPVGWYAYMLGERVIEAACSEACAARRHWADVDGYRTVHLLAQLTAAPAPARPAPPPPPSDLLCHHCGAVAWVLHQRVTARGLTLVLSCTVCHASVRVPLAD
jgi:hypothetical protein